MSNSIYVALTRQDGLMKEMQVVANNLANSSTTGFKSDSAIFAEFLSPTDDGRGALSMGGLAGHGFDLSQGSLQVTGGRFDVAIQGEGFFQVNTPQGERLTRAGHFQLGPDGTMIDTSGNPVAGISGGPINIPPGTGAIVIAGDGTVSADGQLIDQLGVFTPNGQLAKDTGTLFIAEGGFEPMETPRVVQGALEQSNVSPVLEISRMIDVQRAYEAGQSLIEKEDQRLSQLITAIRQG